MSKSIFKCSFLIVFLLFNSTLFSQALKSFDKDFFLFIDHKNKTPVLLLDDSISYTGYDFKKSKINGLPNNIPFKHFYPVSIYGGTYIVDKGCGPVFKYENNTLTRIDKSFRHQNQFNSTIFTYNNRIHFFGGYGMFTDKNIVTYFDENTGGWLELPIDSKERPSRRSFNNSILIKDKLYVWHGVETHKTIIPKDVDDNTIWVLNLKNNNWGKIGKTEKLFSFLLNKKLSFQKDEILYILTKSNFYKIDILKNSISTYKFTQPHLVNFIYDPYSDKIILINEDPTQGTKNIVIKTLDEITKNKTSQTTFYTPSWVQKICVGLGIFVLLIFLFILLKNRIKASKTKNVLIYHKDKKEFIFNKQPILFEKELHLLLVFLINNQQQFILLDKINELFTKKDLEESYVTINKRRDSAFNKLLFILKTLLNKEVDEILIERKSSKDKRVKEIKLGIAIKVIN